MTEAASMAQPAAPQLTKAEKAALAQERTESMTADLDLTGKQARKVGTLNKRFADVLGEVKPLGKPIYGGPSGPYYDTPGRPHPGGKNGVPGSWSRNPDGAPAAGGIGIGPAPDSGESGPAPISEKTLKRRARYVKKLGKILTAGQFSLWKSSQRPFPGEDQQ
mgnify:CR=1 FL=1